jgi:hypothetical protein
VSLGVALDVAIGLIFVYLLLGMLASAVQEFVAAVFKLRGRQLRNSLISLLAGNSPIGLPDNNLFNNVFGHSLVQGYTKSEFPTYISAKNFSLALLHVLTDGTQAPLFSQAERTIAALPNGPAKESLTAILMQTGGDIDKLQAGIQTWFDDAMDRVSGIYKRFTQYFTLVFGLIVAIGLNINSIDIAKTLWTEPESRSAIVQMAEKYATANPATTADAGKPNDDGVNAAASAVKHQADDLLTTLGSLIPVGWSSAIWEKQSWIDQIKKSGGVVSLLIGWLITGFAVSLGAPLLFDMLQNVINLINAGPKPARSDKQT